MVGVFLQAQPRGMMLAGAYSPHLYDTGELEQHKHDLATLKKKAGKRLLALGAGLQARVGRNSRSI